MYIGIFIWNHSQEDIVNKLFEITYTLFLTNPCILSLVFSSCQFLVCLVLLIYYNVFVGILAFLFSLLNYYLPRMTSKKLQKYADDEALQRRRLLNRFYELIKGYSVIKSFGWIEKYLRKADRQIAETVNTCRL